MVDEMEKAGHHPHLANPTEAKKRMGKANKTDALDAKGLAILLHNGTLPESWIPPGELRDRRELLRTRMALRDLRSSLKHRIHAAIDRYGLQATGISDLFGVKGRVYIDAVLGRPPCDTAAMIRVQLASLDQLEVQIEEIEERIAATPMKPNRPFRQSSGTWRRNRVKCLCMSRAETELQQTLGVQARPCKGTKSKLPCQYNRSWWGCGIVTKRKPAPNLHSVGENSGGLGCGRTSRRPDFTGQLAVT
jgi:hypothetical protein